MQRPITIDPEIASLCPPLTVDERAGLEASVLAEGCRDPLVVWDTATERILLDGHNRLEICQRHGKEYTVRPMQFDDRLGAMIWVLQNQRSRRNLTDDQRAMLADRERELLSKRAVSEGRKQNAAARWGCELDDASNSHTEVTPRNTRYGFVNQEETRIIRYFIGDLSIFRQNEPRPVGIFGNDPGDSRLAAYRLDSLPPEFVVKRWPDAGW